VIKDVECFDPHLNEWNFAAELLRPRRDASAATLHEQIYVVGGKEIGQFWASSPTSLVEAYDPRQGKWRVIASLPTAREASVVLSSQEFLYVITGRGQRGYVSNVERYDPRNNTWTSICPSSPTERGWACGVSAGDRFYGNGNKSIFKTTLSIFIPFVFLVIGGDVGKENRSKTVEIFDTKNAEWFKVADMSVGRGGAAAAIV